MNEAHKDEKLSRPQVYFWYKRFKDDRKSIADDSRSGRPLTSTRYRNIGQGDLFLLCPIPLFRGRLALYYKCVLVYPIPLFKDDLFLYVPFHSSGVGSPCTTSMSLYIPFHSSRVISSCMSHSTLQGIMPRQDFVIASDCQAALHAICHPDIPRTPLTAEIIRNLNTLDNVQLCWVRGHCGIVGNEQADEVAKAAAQSNLPLHFATLPRKYVRSQSKQFALQLWTDLYTTDHATRNLRRVAASPSLLISILPKLKYNNITSTILTGHGFVQADIARTSKNNDPVCQHCHQENQTVDHLLFSCPSYRLQRFQTATLLNTSTFNQEALKNLPKNKTAWRHLISWMSTATNRK
ncbi:hypothetical protein LAZ67_14002780 [Cordylochernes scorpioides]|uniref:RNase H type-1 domain-containing protein n=1 Tax=Cordylochernes scorpioides TaxID=51811 RepID=A0ABY6L773_9ARAC|nr:hypothetical protein LAZ67_14002780 [Cordylochernes scorpioides]